MSTAIEFNNISKQYRLGVVSSGTIRADFQRWWQMNIRHQEDPFLKVGETNDRASKGSSEYVWALKDIDFKVEQGDVVGIIGKNGAGKSTLLKILSKVTGPTTGTIRAKGRIGSLLEVGTGFHPEMTGRENIYLNGAILGMSKPEIKRKLDEIVDFSGCERYIDTPVKRYSSGMMVRLGFAVAAHLDPEILVVDEVLAVGDAEFQKKAIGKMQDVSKGEGRTVLFVSHNMASIRALCNHGVLLENGMVKRIGNINNVIEDYLESHIETKETIISNFLRAESYLNINEIVVNGHESNPVCLSSTHPLMHIQIRGELQIDVKLAFEMRVCDNNGIPLAFYSPCHYLGSTSMCSRGKFEIDEVIEFPENMSEGQFYCSFYLTEPGVKYHMQMERAVVLCYEGYPMRTGHVFHYSNGNGLLFLKKS